MKDLPPSNKAQAAYVESSIKTEGEYQIVNTPISPNFYYESLIGEDWWKEAYLVFRLTSNKFQDIKWESPIMLKIEQEI